MGANGRGLYHFRRDLLILWLTAGFRVLSAKVSAAPTCGAGQGDEHMPWCSNDDHRFCDLDEPEDHAIIQANHFKSLERPSVPLDAWQAGRFAFEDGRAQEFEALRIDQYPCDFQVPRRHISEITPASFREDFEKASMPVMLLGIPEAMGWAARERWTWEGLEKNYSEVEFKVAVARGGSALRMKMGDFLRYARTQKDDSPLYIFDGRFVEFGGELRMERDYAVPDLFPEDLFSFAGQRHRPSYRWMLVGPKRSGTGVHIDPLGTSAWNTVLSGRKLWVMSPPGTKAELLDSATGNSPDPAATAAAEGDLAEAEAEGDLAEAEAEGDLAEAEAEDKDEDEKSGVDEFSKEAVYYFLNTLPGVRERLGSSFPLYVVVQHPGETLFVPSGWVHGVINLDDTVSVTQNFVSSVNFDQVWRKTRNERPQFGVFWLRKLLTSRPELVLRALKLDEEDEFDLVEALRMDDEDKFVEMCEEDEEEDDLDGVEHLDDEDDYDYDYEDDDDDEDDDEDNY